MNTKDDEPRVYRLDELEAELAAEEEELSKQCYIKDDFIVLDEGRYEVALDRCSSPEAILEWVHHLTEKNWMTVPVLGRFIDLTSEHHGINIHIGA